MLTQKQIIAVLFFLIAASLFAQPYNGTAVGTLTYITGAHNQGIQGPAPGSYLTVPSGAVNFAGDFSIGFKFRATVDEGYQTIFYSNNLGCDVYGFSGVIYCNFGGVAWNSTGGDMSDGSWHEASIRRVGTTASIWIDGTNRGSATVGTANLGTATSAFLANFAGGGGVPATSAIDELSIWTTGTPTACNPCTGSESGLRALYHLDNNLTDSATGGGAGVVSGSLSPALGLLLGAATGGTSPYSYQLQSYSGACVGGTFANDGAALTGQTSTALFARSDSATKCYRVVVTDAASATSNSNSITAPASGGGMRSN